MEKDISRSGSELSHSDLSVRSHKLPVYAETYQMTVVGSLNMDQIWVIHRLPRPTETLTVQDYRTSPGGKGAIQAIACARLSRPKPTGDQDLRRSSATIPRSPSVNIEVNMIGAVGRDTAGSRIMQALNANGVRTRGVLQCQDVRTGVASIALENSGENNVLVFPGANDKLSADQVGIDFQNSPPALLMLQNEIPMKTVVDLIRKAAKAGVPILLNAAPVVQFPTDVYKHVEHLIVNEIEANGLLDHAEDDGCATRRSRHQVDRASKIHHAKQMCTGLLDRGPQHVVITLGAYGGVAGSKKSSAEQFIVEYQAAVVDDVVDTTGCGGVFIGAYAVEYVRQRPAGGDFDITRAVKWAAKAAAASARHLGSLAGVPWESDIEAA
jgi:ribokinase